MVKKISHSLVALLLLITTTGLAVSKHYCHDRFISASLFSEADICCGESDCCHNETTFYQVDEDFAFSVSAQLPQILDCVLFLHIAGPFNLLYFPKPAEDLIVESVFYPPPNIQRILARKQSWLL